MNKEENSLDRSKKITFLPMGGIASRLRAIASVIYLARQYARRLDILWLIDDSMPVFPDRLFTLVPGLRSEGINLVQGVWYDRIFNTPPAPSNLYLTYPFANIRHDRVLSPRQVEHLLETDRGALETIISQQDKSLLLATRESLGFFPHMFDAIEPTVEVNNVLLSSTASWKSKVVGVHINRRINPESTNNESPIELFIKRMQEMIEADPEINFFIATTSNDERERLATIFHNRVFVPNRGTVPYSLKGVIQSMGELLALSHTERILSSPGSTYSRVAAEMGQIPLETLSIYSTNS